METFYIELMLMLIPWRKEKEFIFIFLPCCFI